MLNKITTKEVNELVVTGHVVFGYPRKQIIMVDGFKRYSASPQTIKALKLLSANNIKAI